MYGDNNSDEQNKEDNGFLNQVFLVVGVFALAVLIGIFL